MAYFMNGTARSWPDSRSYTTFSNAVLDALAPLGVRALDMPASSEPVWEAIRAARASQPA